MDSTYVADAPLGYVQVLAAAVDAGTALPSIPRGTVKVTINVEGSPIRWRDDGTNPTASVGMLVPAGTTFDYRDQGLSSFRAVSATAGAILNISYYGTR